MMERNSRNKDKAIKVFDLSKGSLGVKVLGISMMGLGILTFIAGIGVYFIISHTLFSLLIVGITIGILAITFIIAGIMLNIGRMMNKLYIFQDGYYYSRFKLLDHFSDEVVITPWENVDAVTKAYHQGENGAIVLVQIVKKDGKSENLNISLEIQDIIRTLHRYLLGKIDSNLIDKPYSEMYIDDIKISQVPQGSLQTSDDNIIRTISQMKTLFSEEDKNFKKRESLILKFMVIPIIVSILISVASFLSLLLPIDFTSIIIIITSVISTVIIVDLVVLLFYLLKRETKPFNVTNKGIQTFPKIGKDPIYAYDCYASLLETSSKGFGEYFVLLPKRDSVPRIVLPMSMPGVKENIEFIRKEIMKYRK